MHNDLPEFVWYQENDLAGQGEHVEYWTKKSSTDFTALAYAPENRLLWGVESLSDVVDALNRRRSIPEFLTKYAEHLPHLAVMELCHVIPKRDPRGARQEYIARLEEAVRHCQEPVYLQHYVASDLIFEVLDRAPSGDGIVALSPGMVLRWKGWEDCLVELTDASDLWRTQQRQAKAREKIRGARRVKRAAHLAALRECQETCQVYRGVSRAIDEMLPEGIIIPSPVYTSNWPTYTHCPWGEQMRILYYALVWKDPLRIRNKVLQALKPVEDVWKTCRYWGENCLYLRHNMCAYARKRGKRVGQLFSASLIDAVEHSRKHPFTFSETDVTESDRKRLDMQRRRGSNGNPGKSR